MGTEAVLKLVRANVMSRDPHSKEPMAPRWLRGERLYLQHRRHRRHGFDTRVGKIPWRRAWQPTPIFLPGESHGQRSLAGYSP